MQQQTATILSAELPGFQTLEPIPLKGGTESIAIYEPLKKKRKKLELVPTAERKIVSEIMVMNEDVENLITKIIKSPVC